MKKLTTILGILYYPADALAYLLLMKLASLMIDADRYSLGMIMAATYALLFVGFPVLTAILMRFSLLKWILDPFAAAVPSLLVYGLLVFGQRRQWHGLYAAILNAHRELTDDGGTGLHFLIGLFLFGLLCTLSFARRRGESLSYRLIGRIRDKRDTEP